MDTRCDAVEETVPERVLLGTETQVGIADEQGVMGADEMEETVGFEPTDLLRGLLFSRQIR